MGICRLLCNYKILYNIQGKIESAHFPAEKTEASGLSEIKGLLQIRVSFHRQLTGVTGLGFREARTDKAALGKGTARTRGFRLSDGGEVPGKYLHGPKMAQPVSGC